MTLNSEEIKPIALAVIELCLSEGISQIVGQSVSKIVSQAVEKSNKVFLKFHSNFMQRFRVNLWAWLCLTKCCHVVRK